MNWSHNRWLKVGGVLLFVIPQSRLAKCARLLSEQFTDTRVFRLTEPPCRQFNQIAALATRRKRHARRSDAALLDGVRYLEMLSTKTDLEPLGDIAEVCYEVPASEPVVLTNMGIRLDEVEDLLPESSAYRQAARVLLPKHRDVRGRPLTPLHGGHVGLLCTAGMLNGVFGEGEDRHIAHWRSVKFNDHWEEGEEDGTRILHDRQSVESIRDLRRRRTSQNLGADAIGEPGLRCLEAALNRVGPEAVAPTLRSLRLNSLEQVFCLETLKKVVLAAEEAAGLTHGFSPVGSQNRALSPDMLIVSLWRMSATFRQAGRSSGTNWLAEPIRRG